MTNKYELWFFCLIKTVLIFKKVFLPRIDLWWKMAVTRTPLVWNVKSNIEIILDNGHKHKLCAFVSKNVVYVFSRILWLLSCAGFLRTKASFDKSESSAENLGIKDIAAALRWIKINIAAFGGDPSRVTLVGHDTGAALVNLLFVSPNSKGI
jgi:hypothetical protein